MTDAGFPELVGGVACLDFANTLDGRATAQPEEYLRSYADLVRWAGYAGLLDEATGRRLATTPAAAGAAGLRAALELREAVFRVFTAVGRGDLAAPADLAVVQHGYAAAMAAARLAPSGRGSGPMGYGWEFGDDPDRAWWPLAVSAAELLTTGPLDRVKLCAAEAGCLGLFLDTSKNRSRRWCSMAGCGVEAKVQRQAVRRRSARS